jgi:murein DD-endopeptidase MepM/ murein hydrolase activator NlpD
MRNEANSARTGWLKRWFPVRFIYLRTGDEVQAYALTARRQILMGAVALGLVGWGLVASCGFVIDMIGVSKAERSVAEARATSERVNADLQARLETAVVRMTASTGSLEELAQMVERRHAALTQVMGMFHGVDGAELELQPIIATDSDGRTPTERMSAVRMDQERLIARAQQFAETRAERLRLAFRLAGLNPAAYVGQGTSLGGPLIQADDPSAMAAILDVDEPFATRILSASRNLGDMRDLTDAATYLPFDRPTQARTTSGFGVRFDPFNGRPALHQGQDFAAPLNTPIHATAPGVVSFVGVRSGYGNTVEIDHGGGFKTRYAHLNSTAVQIGQRVALGQRIGAMGSTGRSTGVHLHYEVWMNGRAQNPARFMRAGDYLVQ